MFLTTLKTNKCQWVYLKKKSTLRKTLLSGDVVEKSEEFLSTLLLLASATEKEHTKY
jgi:hypothetical protein